MSDKSHFDSLESLLQDSLERIGGHIPTTTIESVLPRSNDNSIFKEGERFGVLVTIGSAESCITIPAAPHVHPSIRISDFKEAKTEVLSNDRLPEMKEGVEVIAPHLIVWWRNKSEPDLMKFDFVDISRQDERAKNDFSMAIKESVLKGVSILTKLNHRPVIGGSWGNATGAERKSTGLSRGLPTIGLGHLHIQDLEDDQENIDFDEVANYKEIVDNLSPWNRLLLHKFAPIGRRIVEDGINRVLKEHRVKCRVSIENQYRELATGVKTQEEGYEVALTEKIDLEVIFNLLFEIAGKFESFYYSILKEYPNFFKFDSESQEYLECILRIRESSARFGLTDEETSELIRFVQIIKPTYAQLLLWRSELLDQSSQDDQVYLQIENLGQLITRYERHNKFVSNKGNTSSLRDAIIFDTYRSPDRFEEIGFTWPVHFSACYLIEDYILEGNRILTDRLRLFPGIASTTSIRRMSGTALRRKSQKS